MQEFPRPRNITGIRSWFGLTNQLAFTFSTTKIMQLFRDLLKPSSEFIWTEELQQAFDTSKDHIISAIHKGVTIYETSRTTALLTDWSKVGLGFVLMQKHCTCPGKSPLCCSLEWKVTFVGSRFCSPAESRYAPIEGESLEVAWSLEKAKYFVLGHPDLIVAVDHQPLFKLLGDRAMEDIPNPRLFNLKEKTLRYRFSMTFIPGKNNHSADAASRQPASREFHTDLLFNIPRVAGAVLQSALSFID